ncbi:Tetratricopeptide repeat protein [compost metagenome]
MNCITVSKRLYINFLFLFFIFYTGYINAQSDNSAALQECRELLAEGQGFYQAKEFQKALESTVKAEALAEKNKWDDELFSAEHYIGLIYEELSNSGEALNHFTKAYKIALRNPKSQRSVVTVLNNVGILYHKEQKYKEALNYYQRAYDVAVKEKFKDIIAHFAINMAAVSNEMGEYNKAIDYLEEVKDEPKKVEMDQAWRICYAESLILSGKIEKAKKIVDQLSLEVGGKKNYRNNIDVFSLYAKIYNRLNKFDEGIKYANKGLRYNKNIGMLHWNVILYEELSDLYFNKGDYKVGKKYVDSIFIAKDSISNLLKLQLYESNKIKFDVQEYQNELKINKEKYEAERILFIIGIAFSLILFYFIYRGLKNRIIKQKQEKIIADNEQKIVSLEMEGLKNNIAEKNRRLSTKALYLSGRNELIEEVINSLTKIPEVTENKEVANYIKTLKEYLKTDAEWDDFITYFEQVNHDFFRALKTKHPQLTPQDIRFLCYIYMNLDIKEISSIFSITSEAGRKRKQRIAKKMDVDIDDLHEYIIKIN